MMKKFEFEKRKNKNQNKSGKKKLYLNQHRWTNRKYEGV